MQLVMQACSTHPKCGAAAAAGAAAPAAAGAAGAAAAAAVGRAGPCGKAGDNAGQCFLSQQVKPQKHKAK